LEDEDAIDAMVLGTIYEVRVSSSVFPPDYVRQSEPSREWIRKLYSLSKIGTTEWGVKREEERRDIFQSNVDKLMQESNRSSDEAEIVSVVGAIRAVVERKG
jgi:hypothetical protein